MFSFADGGIGLNGYALYTSLQSPFSGSGTQIGGIVDGAYSTDIGPLVISGHTDQAATFTVSAPSPVPEIDPATFGSAFALLIGSLGLVEQRRRRGLKAVLAG
jgi:hypothetical protein